MAKILIVEDEANIRKFMAVNLGARGYTVIEARDAGEGLARLRESSPDLLLLDIKLPDMSGWELLRIAAATPGLPQVPVIVITASFSHQPPQQIRYQKLRKILSKPLSVDELTESVKEALRPEIGEP